MNNFGLNSGSKSKWPSFYQWSQFFRVLGKKERNMIFALLFLFFVALGFAGYQFYLKNTEFAPALSGSYSEGIIGSPHYLNPLLSPASGDADMDLAHVIFSSLFKYDGQGNLIPELAERYAIGEEGKFYDVFLRQNAFWHDGRQVTADDVIFTMQIIQNRDYDTPLRLNWLGIETEKIDQYTIRFKIKNAYATFPHNLTFGILPKHIWQNVSPSEFALNERNLKPIGSGPYVFSELEKNKDGQIVSVKLQANSNYYLSGPFIKDLIFKFYPDEDKALAALRKSEIQGISYLSPKNQSGLSAGFKNGLNILQIRMPRYFSLFINQTASKALSDKNVRQALAHAIDKNKLITEIFHGFGQKIDSPILAGMTGYSDQIKIYEFDVEKAKNILQTAGWTDANNDGVREKGEENLELTITTIPWPELAQTANLISDFWKEIGVKTTIETKEATSLIQENIRPRQYQILLFGELLNIDPDLFAFWHSSQKKDPGQNLSLYENAQVDAILQDARQDLDPASRAKKYEQFSQILAEDLAAIFLYAPDYLYPSSSQIKGIDLKILNSPSDRFSQIENWYLTTKRVWKTN